MPEFVGNTGVFEGFWEFVVLNNVLFWVVFVDFILVSLSLC
ncbi:hypothetical protein [Flavobacterium sp. HJSW_4]